MELEGKNGQHDARPDVFTAMKVDNSVRLATAVNCRPGGGGSRAVTWASEGPPPPCPPPPVWGKGAARRGS